MKIIIWLSNAWAFTKWLYFSSRVLDLEQNYTRQAAALVDRGGFFQTPAGWQAISGNFWQYWAAVKKQRAALAGTTAFHALTWQDFRPRGRCFQPGGGHGK